MSPFAIVILSVSHFFFFFFRKWECHLLKWLIWAMRFVKQEMPWMLLETRTLVLPLARWFFFFFSLLCSVKSHYFRFSQCFELHSCIFFKELNNKIYIKKKNTAFPSPIREIHGWVCGWKKSCFCCKFYSLNFLYNLIPAFVTLCWWKVKLFWLLKIL